MTVRTQVSLDPERHGALGEEAVPRWTTSEGAEATQPSREGGRVVLWPRANASRTHGLGDP